MLLRRDYEIRSQQLKVCCVVVLFRNLQPDPFFFAWFMSYRVCIAFEVNNVVCVVIETAAEIGHLCYCKVFGVCIVFKIGTFIVGYHHTNSNAPVPVRSPKLNEFRPS